MLNVFSTWVLTISSQKQNVLSVQWPAGLCKAQNKLPDECNIPTSDIWTIHGLWPKYRRHPSQQQFTYASISHLEHQLNRFWPNVLDKDNNQNFWKYQWMKHGIYLKFNYNKHVTEYFIRTLKVYKNVRKILDVKLKPSYSYLKTDIQQTLDSAFKAKVVLHCRKCIDDFYMDCLVEIRICYDDHIQHRIDCTTLSKCNEHVLIYSS